MTARPLSILTTGMVCSVGLTAPAACAAIRARLTNPTETFFVDEYGERYVAHQVPMKIPYVGRTRLAYMAAHVVHQCLATGTSEDAGMIPLFLCVAEPTRPGRVDGLNDTLFQEIEQICQIRFSPQSFVVAQGRVGVATALLRARELIYEGQAESALIVAVDSLLVKETLEGFGRSGRLLTTDNSNGFMPGEGAAGLLVTRPGAEPGLCVDGIGVAVEAAHIESEDPLRADGLVSAVRGALRESSCELHDLDVRITDSTGEQYYFKEAALALARILRQRKEEFDIWHPADCIGEIGSAIGPALLAVASAACKKGYSPGPGVLIHLGNDLGERAAIVARHR